MELDAIAVFVRVVEAGSFSQAARLMKMPKTTVSAKVAALEKRLGVTLIHRTTRQLSVTDVGRDYYHHCASAIQEIEKGESELLSTRGKPKGTLKITAPADFAHTVLPPILCKYLDEYPEVDLQLILTNRLVDLISEGVDLAIRASELKDSSLIARKFFDIQSSFWATPNYVKKYGMPENPRDLTAHQVVMRSESKETSVVVTDGKSTQTLKLQARIRADDFEAVKALILLDRGIAWMPDFIADQDMKNKKLIRVVPKWRIKSAFPMYFVYPGRKYESPRVRAFIDLATRTLNRD